MRSPTSFYDYISTALYAPCDSTPVGYIKDSVASIISFYFSLFIYPANNCVLSVMFGNKQNYNTIYNTI